jgi:hypothetical protein
VGKKEESTLIPFIGTTLPKLELLIMDQFNKPKTLRKVALTLRPHLEIDID